MPQPLSFIKLRDAEYVDQFAGSVVPELKDAQKVLNERYDLAEENDSIRAAIAREMMQNVAEKDKGQAQLAYKRAMDDIEANKARGDYENMYGKTANSARQFSVNAAKFIGEKKRIDSYLDQLNKREKISNEKKAVLRDMALSKQNALSFDSENNIVAGEGFKEDAFADDVNVDVWANKMSEGFIPDQTSWNGGKFIRKKTGDGGDRLMFVDNKGTEKFVTPTDVENYVSDIAKVDPEMQGYIDRLTKERLHQAGEDWRNPDPNNYNLIRKDVESEVLAPTKRAMGNKFGFSQIVTDRNYQQDAVDAYKKKLGLAPKKYDDNPRQIIPSTTIQSLKEVDLEDLTKTKKTTSSVTGVGGSGFGTFASSTPTVLERKGKSIDELQAEVDDNGSPIYPGLSAITKMIIKNKGESEQDYAKRVNPTYKSFLSKISTHQGTQEGLAASEIEPYTNLVLGPERKEGTAKVRTGGGYFSNSPIWIEQNGSFTNFQNGMQAIEKGALTYEDLAKFSITGLNQNYGDFGGAYEGVGSIGNNSAKIFVGGSPKQRRYLEPLSMAENFIAKGEPTTFKTQILDGDYEVPVEIYVEPLPKDKFTVNKKGEFTSITPQVTITDPSGRSRTMDYSKFKDMLIRVNPYKDANQNKQVSNEGAETFKDIPLD